MYRSRTLLSAAVGFAAIMLAAAPARATIVLQQETGTCNPFPCDQSVNFTPANSGTTVVGDTNPAPVYQVFVDSLQSPALTLHGSGSTVDTGVGGPGFTDIDIRPQAGFAWGVIDFQLDSLIKNPGPLISGLTLIATDVDGTKFTANLNFPWEGNNGENQHYVATASNGEAIVNLEIQYTDPNAGEGNTIQDIHNIDVGAAERIPEPTTAAIFGVALLGLGMLLYRERRV